MTSSIRLLAALAVLCTGCSTVQEPEPERLPFHLGLAPLNAEAVEPGGEGVDGVPVEVSEEDLGQLTGRLAAAMEPFFTQVEQVDSEAGAEYDILLEGTLKYPSVVASETNDRFWLNLPLFLLGGPLCWFVNDRTYSHEVRLEVSFMLPHGEKEELFGPTLEDTESQLDFLDRADGATDYALSLVWPAGWLATETEGTEEALLTMISEELVQGLIRDLARNSDRLLNDRDSDFVLQSVRLEPATDGSWELEGTVDVDATAAEMGICMVRCGGVDHELEFEYLPLGMRGARRYQRLQFRQRFEPEEAATVQLELYAQGDEEGRRTYTFDLGMAQAGIAQEMTYTGGVRFVPDEPEPEVTQISPR